MTSSQDYTRYTDAQGVDVPDPRGNTSPADYTRFSDPSAPPTLKAGADDATVFSEPPAPGADLQVHGGDDLPDLRSGPKVIKDRFILEKLIGVGGMGAVYKARDKRRVEAQDRNPFIAVKLLNNKFKKHPAAFLSLQREASKSQTLAHPNIVPVYDFDRADDLVFMTMELQTGASLEKVIKNNPQGIPYSRALSITQEAGRALQYAHEHNIVHADFKPGNVFLTETGRVKIFDFGIARAVKHVDEAVAEVDTAFDPSTLGGLTPAYATWEMLKGEEPDASDDVFALACMFYELLSGRHPYKRVPVNRAWRKLIWPKRIKSIKRAQWKVLSRALSIRRKRRYVSVQHFLDDFVNAEEERRLELPADKIFAAVSIVVIWGLLTQAYDFSHERKASEVYKQLSSQWSSEAQVIRHRGIVQREQLSELLLSDLAAPDNYQRLLKLRRQAFALYEDSSWLDRYAGRVRSLPEPLIARWQKEKQVYENEANIHRRWLERFDTRLGFLGIELPATSASLPGNSTCNSEPGPFECADYLNNGSALPMVRLPADDAGRILIVAQREVSVRDYSEYCNASGRCQPQGNGLWPVTGLQQQEIDSYLQWLSTQTGFRYQLPTLSQWQRAALAGQGEYQVAANCRVAQSMFTHLPPSVSRVNAGEANPWGLINMVGNVQELVRTNLRTVAIGSHFLSGAASCNAYHVSVGSIEGNDITGFRYVRLLDEPTL